MNERATQGRDQIRENTGGGGRKREGDKMFVDDERTKLRGYNDFVLDDDEYVGEAHRKMRLEEKVRGLRWDVNNLREQARVTEQMLREAEDELKMLKR